MFTYLRPSNCIPFFSVIRRLKQAFSSIELRISTVAVYRQINFISNGDISFYEDSLAFPSGFMDGVDMINPVQRKFTKGIWKNADQ